MLLTKRSRQIFTTSLAMGGFYISRSKIAFRKFPRHIPRGLCLIELNSRRSLQSTELSIGHSTCNRHRGDFDRAATSFQETTTRKQDDTWYNSNTPTREEIAHKPWIEHDTGLIGVDIGGSLIKIAYFQDATISYALITLQIEAARIDECVSELQRTAIAKPRPLKIISTGGGSVTFREKLRSLPGTQVFQKDEMYCLQTGLGFVLAQTPNGAMMYNDQGQLTQTPPSQDIYPHLIVNIGSGITFLKVTGLDTYERIGGTPLGGGALCGLASLLGYQDYDETIRACATGDSTKVDLLVSDIYRGGYNEVGLDANSVASYFAKIGRKHRDTVNDGSFANADAARSVLDAISHNTGQLAYLYAQLHGLSDIYFTGSYLRGNELVIRKLTHKIETCSGKSMRAYFLHHAGHIGAIGALVHGLGMANH